MRKGRIYVTASVLPTVIVVSLLILIGLAGLMSLWSQETLLFARHGRLRSARCHAESAYTLYRTHPDVFDVSSSHLLYDTLPGSLVHVTAEPWGLYEIVQVTTGDSLFSDCRLYGQEPQAEKTFFYADNRSVVTLAGNTILHGKLRLPANGLMYGRMNSDFFCGEEIRAPAISRATPEIPRPDTVAVAYVQKLFAGGGNTHAALSSDRATFPFAGDSAMRFRLGNAELAECNLQGKIILYADELRVDASCRLENVLVCARKITVGAGARIRCQLFARDTIRIEPQAVLEYPSGIYSQTYAEIGDGVTIDGYAIIRDTTVRKKITANYRQAPTARVRGMLWIDGVAQVQGIVSGCAVLRQAVYFSPQGYYKDMLYNLTVLENPHTVQPLWLAGRGRKAEALCID